MPICYANLNTSHVKVNPNTVHIDRQANKDLNTSHVKVNLTVTFRENDIEKFKYISC